MHVLLATRKVSLDKAKELIRHIENPSDEETSSERENGIKIIKVARATYRSQEVNILVLFVRCFAKKCHKIIYHFIVAQGPLRDGR